ncbi:T9SS type B sorting domain-containing protein [Flavobacterium sp.]|uniref:T9SS type B sorting domain-containing protein n=1 Tax=Flavobacterium sp. TaxID=239 RepID=UPI00261A6D61|nr:T9SS type B sorting domain-containing protein [Flavobacterium sp.]
MKCIFRLLWLCILTSGSLYAQSDCPDAIIVCGNDDYYGLNATGIGVQELGPNACFSAENNSLWLKIMIKEGGTLGFTLTPEEIDDLVVDFDFWIFGPDAACSSLGTAIRCSTTNPLAAGLSYNTTGMNDTETDVSEGLGPNGNSFVQWMDVNDGDIYYLIIDRPHGASNFSIEWTGSATFHDIPVFNNPDNIPLDMVQCDNDGIADGKSVFDLTAYQEMFIGSQTGVALTYHLSENDMLTGDNALQNPQAFINTEPVQTIYMRMADVVTGCFSNLTYTVAVTPGIGNLQDLYACDDDGITTFNLAENDIAAANGSLNAVVSYYASQDEAESATNSIGPLYQNLVPYQQQTIWARLDKADEGCVDFATFTINPQYIPVFATEGNLPPNLLLCDNDGSADGFRIFDLTINENAMVGNQENILFKYYEDMAGLPAPNPIAFPEQYTNVFNPQTIHIKIENSFTGCYTTSTFTITVSPGAGTPQNLSLCDDDGIAVFDLSVNDAAVANGSTNAQVSYYSSLQDAQEQENSISSLYENTTAFATQTIWARLDKAAEGCTDFTSFTITPVQPPQFNVPGQTLPTITTCDNVGDEDGIAVFDITANEALLSGNQQGITFTYYEDVNGSPSPNPIANPESYTNTQNLQLIHIMATNGATGCSVTSSFILEVIPGAGTPQNLYGCSETGFAVFDLSQNNSAVANGNSQAVISYYASEQDAQNGTNALGSQYQNSAAFTPEYIWARYEVLNGSCYEITYFTINVFTAPVLHNPDNITLGITKCDDDGVNDVSTLFDITIYEEMFTGSQQDIAITYHTTSQDAETGGNEIENPMAYANTANPQTVYVRMENTLAGCYITTSFPLNIEYTIPTGTPQDLLLCDFEGNGLQIFDLWQNNELVRDGNTSAAITYHASEQDAENGINPLPRFYINSEPYFNEEIWARLENTEGCFGYGIVPFIIGILPIPDTEYNLSIVDFTENENSVTIAMENNPEGFEFSLDNITYSDSNIFENLEPGLYTIYVRSKDNCTSFTIEAPVLNYPRFFTPNGDGSNEVWNVDYIRFFPDARITIFDRYGKLIKSYMGKEMGWEGTYNGENLPSTDYWFLLEFATGRKIKGHFALVR